MNTTPTKVFDYASSGTPVLTLGEKKDRKMAVPNVTPKTYKKRYLIKPVRKILMSTRGNINFQPTRIN